ncbi:MAG: hypothetical protein AAGF07_03240 [Patescibacteria group bacterium]
MPEINISQYTKDQLNQFKRYFSSQLSDTASGNLKDFSYLKTQLKKQSELLTGNKAKFQVMTIGGTNFLTAVADYKDKKVAYHDERRLILPRLSSKEVLQNFVLQNLSTEIEVLAINFGYPIKSILRQGRLDAELLRGTKDHLFEGLVGRNVGEELEQYISHRLGRSIKIVLANDIVCMLASQNSNNQNLCACIVGTGYNLGFIDKNNSYINLESGNFKQFTQSNTGKVVDKNSTNPSTQLFEKEVAGAYLYRHYNFIAKDLGWSVLDSTAELESLSRQPSPPQSDLANQIFQHSAALVAVQIAGLYEFKNKQELAFVIEGGVYWKVKDYPTYLQKYLNLLGVDLNQITFLKQANHFDGVARLVI